MNKDKLLTLIDAYADAKVSKNPVLIRFAVDTVRKALDELLPDVVDEEDEPVGK